jgi:hypothetical protein
MDMYNGEKNIVERFDSIEAMCKRYREAKPNYKFHSSSQSPDRALEMALSGDESLVPEAEKILLSLSNSLESVGPFWEPDVFGSVVSIPAYLANVPNPFRRNKHIVSDVSPVRIFVGMVCSGGISEAIMRKRGITIMALAMQLQKIRPVEVIIYNETEAGGRRGGIARDYLNTIRLESRPMSLAHTINAFANIPFTRQLSYGLAWMHGFTGGWPNGYDGAKPSPEYRVWRNGILGITEHDILIESTYYGDPITEDPITWINEHLSLYASQLE